MAATVKSWDPHQGGSAFLDDGSVVRFSNECLRGRAFRLLRPGQRVRLLLCEATVVGVTLP